MSCRRLEHHYEERAWGRLALPAWAEIQPSPGAPIGEIWFVEDEAAPAELLVKFLFTSERLSIQVHPDDAAARALGHPRGKDEAWLVLDAESGAAIGLGLGLKAQVSKDQLRASAIEGSIEQLLDWRPVKAGDFIYSPAGTIHAIGAGLSLIEIQQNLDLTYRLYDYGRPRELHLDEAVAVADPAPYRWSFEPYDLASGRQILAAGGAFVVERWTFDAPARVRSDDGELQLIPIGTGGTIDGAALEAGSVWRVEGDAALDAGGGIDILVAYPGAEVRVAACTLL